MATGCGRWSTCSPTEQLVSAADHQTVTELGGHPIERERGRRVLDIVAAMVADAHAPDDPHAKIMRTEGRPYDGTEIRILDDHGQPLPPGRVGSVIVNGPSRFLGFFNNDDLTRESLTDWGGYRTGDLGMLDEDGHFIYVGRDKDIIRRGGVTIVPAEVEPVILRHPDVHEVAIVPLPDDRLGERACAAIIAKRGHTAPTLAELQEFLAGEGVAKYTWPESIQVFDEFPRTPSLKVVKRDVVTLILDRSEITA